MSWSQDRIDNRIARSGRDKEIDIFEFLDFIVGEKWFLEFVEMLDEHCPRYPFGRPRVHATCTVALVLLLSRVFGGGLNAARFLKSGDNWNRVRRGLHKSFRNDQLLRSDSRPPTKSVVRHYQAKLDIKFFERLSATLEAHWLLYGVEMGLGINRGTKLDVSRNAILYGDSVVLRSMSRFKPGDLAFNPRTRQMQERRNDPDAYWHKTGDRRNIYGNQFVHLSAFTGEPHEHLTFGVKPLMKQQGLTEADIAISLVKEVRQSIPTFDALAWDKAIRSSKVEELWRIGVQPVIGTYNKEKVSTQVVPLGSKKIDGLSVSLAGHKGAVCIIDATGNPVPLDSVKLEYQRNIDSYRPYATFEIPSSTNCDSRLWGKRLKLRMTSSHSSGLCRGEHIRALAPGSKRWNAMYGVRSLAESLNSWLKGNFQRGERARSLTVRGQWFDLMLLFAWRNTKSLVLYRQRQRSQRVCALSPT